MTLIEQHIQNVCSSAPGVPNATRVLGKPFTWTTATVLRFLDQYLSQIQVVCGGFFQPDEVFNHYKNHCFTHVRNRGETGEHAQQYKIFEKVNKSSVNILPLIRVPNEANSAEDLHTIEQLMTNHNLNALSYSALAHMAMHPSSADVFLVATHALATNFFNADGIHSIKNGRMVAESVALYTTFDTNPVKREKAFEYLVMVSPKLAKLRAVIGDDNLISKSIESAAAEAKIRSISDACLQTYQLDGEANYSHRNNIDIITNYYQAKFKMIRNMREVLSYNIAQVGKPRVINISDSCFSEHDRTWLRPMLLGACIQQYNLPQIVAAGACFFNQYINVGEKEWRTFATLDFANMAKALKNILELHKKIVSPRMDYTAILFTGVSGDLLKLVDAFLSPKTPNKDKPGGGGNEDERAKKYRTAIP